MRKAIPLTMVLFFMVGVIIVITSFQPKLPSSSEPKKPTESVKTKFQTTKDFSKLAESYNQILSKTQSEFGITFIDINSREKLSINGEKSFHAASTSKPIVAVYTLKQVDQEKISLSKEIDGLPLSERLRLMINVSDNASWESLLSFFGITQIQGFSRSLGLSNTDHFKNTSASDDLANFVLRLYQDSILSGDSKNFLFKYMQNTEKEDRIPAGVPQKKLVFHKAGSYNGEIHDIGIIEHPKNPFVLAILSQGQNDLDKRPQILAEITRASWDFADSN